ncbi:MAG: hypothetical protein J07HQW2_00296 [Haloquadratum walsbyi J07HQW2]|uniref:Uncharacterized protein n=1 Tax=Haloquadratum walsbyi J07HQW2 TaxID=1238425 RepID=U1PJP2_9EURY|nr:MAG: hypothetical protein J07HQW2_00296 [Haloquadratum walsbyi J07HQW2]
MKPVEAVVCGGFGAADAVGDLADLQGLGVGVDERVDDVLVGVLRLELPALALLDVAADVSVGHGQS